MQLVSAISSSSSVHCILKPLLASAWPFLAPRQKCAKGYFLREQRGSCDPQVLKISFDCLWALHKIHMLDLVQKGCHTLTQSPSRSQVLDRLRCSNSSDVASCRITLLSSHSLLLLLGMLSLAFLKIGLHPSKPRRSSYQHVQFLRCPLNFHSLLNKPILRNFPRSYKYLFAHAHLLLDCELFES